MKTQPDYLSSADFISHLEFDFIETYSFQREIVFEENMAIIKAEFDKLRIQESDKLSPAEAERFVELRDLLEGQQYLRNKTGKFHPSSHKIQTFNHNSSETNSLKQILNTKIREVPRFLCTPVYRDAVVFYNKESKVVSVLNVCLSCLRMHTGFEDVKADFYTYDLIKRFFINIGHAVEDPDYFFMDNIDKMINKAKR